MSLIADYDALLLDLDGTVWEGGRAIPGAVEAIINAPVQALYVTNNASRAPETVAGMLAEIGLATSASQIVTSAQAAVALAAQHVPVGSKVLVIGADSFRDLARKQGFTVVDSADNEPAAVLQGFSPDIGWAQLTEAALALRAGAKYIVSNLDTSLPTERGFAVGNGSLVAAVQTATGIEPISAGKPGSAMFLQAASEAGASRPLAVGDRLDTDIAGGNAASMDTLHVMTGVSLEMALIEAPLEHRPTYLAQSMGDIFAPKEQLRPSAQGGFTARVDGPDILLDKGDDDATSMQALRTVAEVAWAMPHPPRYIQPVSPAAERIVQGWR
ncbi:MAG: HAD-IIA family hydrolase [Corynebacterium sp.]|nr:HAD-IIA family hydrolase [Corynebacterium sp.]